MARLGVGLSQKLTKICVKKACWHQVCLFLAISFANSREDQREIASLARPHESPLEFTLLYQYLNHYSMACKACMRTKQRVNVRAFLTNFIV